MIFRILFLIFFPALALAQNLEITRINPSGEDVASERQIVFEFNKAVVPIGRMERSANEVPIKIEPELDCQWRWINTSSLACQLGENSSLKSATKYNVIIAPKFTALDGSTLENEIKHNFITQRPVVKYTWFNTWKAPGWPVILVSLDQEVDLESVQDHLYFESSTGKRYDLKASSPKDYTKNYILVEPVSELPEAKHYSLNVEPGISALVKSEVGVENRKVVEFDTFGEFKFKGIKCFLNSGDSVLITSESDTSRCNPLNGFEIVFTSPVIKDELQKGILFSPDLAGGNKELDPWQHVYSYSVLSQPHYEENSYSVRIPVMLKAYDSYEVTAEAGKFKDEFGRELKDPIKVKFKTDHRPAKYDYESTYAVLEKEAETEVPIFVTNLEQVNLQYKYLNADNILRSGNKTINLDKIEDISYIQKFGIREILDNKSGVVWGNFVAVPNVYDSQAFFNQITPFQVHAKLGHYNSLVWVTNLSDGKAVESADVEIFVGNMSELQVDRQIKSIAKTDSNGVATLSGLEKLDPDLTLLNSWDHKNQRLFVRVKKGEDVAFLPIHYQFNSYSYSVYPDSLKKFGHIKSWGTTAQGVYKAGDEIDYKIYVRNQNTYTFSNAPEGVYKLEIIDPLGKTVSEVDNIKLNSFGAFDGNLRLSKNAAVGWYRFEVSSNFTDYKWNALTVLVSDFTPSPFKVSNEINGKIVNINNEIVVSTLAKLHSGGPYLEAPVRITANLNKAYFSPVEGYTFGSNDEYYQNTVFNKEAKLDDQGELDQSFVISDPNTPEYGTLVVESAVRDDRGQYVTDLATVKYFSRDRFVGLKSNDWVIEKSKPSKIEAIVVDQEGKLQTGVEVEIEINYLQIKASRVKGAGNAYLTNYVENWIKEDSCKLFSTDKPQACTFTPKNTGDYKITAKIKDTEGRAQESTITKWSVGNGQDIWRSNSENKLEVIAEKKDYKIGDKARFLIKNPFPGARALFTIERYGILKSWTSILNNSSEIIEFEIEQDYLPGVYFSAVVTSPRVADAAIEGDIDLGKPTFRIGYASINIEDQSKRINISVKPEKEIYKPREDVSVNLTLENTDLKPSDVELAVVVLDQAVFDLLQSGSKYFDPYLGFYNLDALDVVNYNILKQLIGLRKFDKKGANAGGDGGRSGENRNLFKYVSYWNPSIKLDSSGKTKINFKAPDNLTGWKVLALVVNKTDRMGLGQGDFKVNKEIEIRPANPNQVLEGDSFTSRFTVMNRSENDRNLKVSIVAEGSLAQKQVKELEILAKPYKRNVISLPIKTNKDGKIVVNITANDDKVGDGLVVEIPVKKKSVIQAAANYGSTTENKAIEQIQFPDNMREDVGRVSMMLSPSVISSLEGAFNYLKKYPYFCWEQRITKAAAASQYLNLKQYVPSTFEWLDAKEVVTKTLEDAQSFQAPNGGMTFYIAQDEHVSPYLSAYTAIAFNWLKKSGYKIPSVVEEKLHSYLLEMLKKEVMPDFYNEGMASSVRAVALAALAENGKLSSDDITRYNQHFPQMSLFGKSFYLQSLKNAQNSEIKKQALDNILSYANESGGKFSFTENLDTYFTRIMESSLRTNCAILSSLLSQNELNQDIPTKLVRFLSQSREKKAHWENTQENIFCLNALSEYAKKYESETPNYKYTVKIDQEEKGSGKFKSFKDPVVEIDTAIKKGDKGRKITAEVDKKGLGRIYYTTRLFYSPEDPGVNSINSGIEIKREYSVEREGKFVMISKGDQIKQGELVKVDLFLSLPAPRNFVVVDDHVPGGLEPINTDLATSSTVDANKAEYQFAESSFWYEKRDWELFGSSFWSFYHKELRHDSVKFYSEYLPKGNYHLSYTAQAIASGEFVIMPAHTEEMYNPDTFGETTSTVLEIIE